MEKIVLANMLHGDPGLEIAACHLPVDGPILGLGRPKKCMYCQKQKKMAGQKYNEFRDDFITKKSININLEV